MCLSLVFGKPSPRRRIVTVAIRVRPKSPSLTVGVRKEPGCPPVLGRTLSRRPYNGRTIVKVSTSVLLMASVATMCAASAEPRKLTSLADGLAPLANRFNNQQDRVQVVAILSPT